MFYSIFLNVLIEKTELMALLFIVFSSIECAHEGQNLFVWYRSGLSS